VLVDSHVHLDRYRDPDVALEDAEAHDVLCVTVTETPSHYQEVAAKLGERPLIHVALGVHPLHAGALSLSDLSLLDDLVRQCDFVGEVGLDGSPEGHDTLAAQRTVFERLLSHPELHWKVLTVHSRGAETEVVSDLARAGAIGALHWYRGSLHDAERAIDAGLYFSINPAMLGTDEGQALIAALPAERVLTETDGPYTKAGRRISRPSDVQRVLRALGDHWELEPDAARRRVWENFAELRRRAGQPI
jgi:TatD DNase family protein